MHSVAGGFCRERNIDWAATLHFRGTVLLGALPAALLLVKINIGIFAILATGLSLSFHTRAESVLEDLQAPLLWPRALFLPFALMRHQLGRSSGTCLLCCVDRICGGVESSPSPQRQRHLDHIQGRPGSLLSLSYSHSLRSCWFRLRREVHFRDVGLSAIASLKG